MFLCFIVNTGCFGDDRYLIIYVRWMRILEGGSEKWLVKVF